MSSDADDYFSACSGSERGGEPKIQHNEATVARHEEPTEDQEEERTVTNLTAKVCAVTVNEAEPQSSPSPQRPSSTFTRGRGGGFQAYKQQQSLRQQSSRPQPVNQQVTPPHSVNPQQISPRQWDQNGRGSATDRRSPFGTRGASSARPSAAMNGDRHPQHGAYNQRYEERQNYNNYNGNASQNYHNNPRYNDQKYYENQRYNNYPAEPQRNDNRNDYGKTRNYEADTEGYQSGSQSETSAYPYHQRQRDQREYEGGNESDDEMDGEDEDYDTNMPRLLRILYANSNSYSEKMGYIAEQILSTTMEAIPTGGYHNLDSLRQHFSADTYTDGEQVASLMGFKSFRHMCLYAPEIADLHTWTLVEQVDGSYAVEAYQPSRITRDNKRLINEKIVGLEHKERQKEMQLDEAQRYINKVMSKTPLPSFKELDYKYRVCQSLDAMNGLKVAVDMGKLKIKHKEMHGEDMNLKLYREMFNRPTNLDNVEYQKERFAVEVSIQRNAAGNGLVYRLKQPLGFIKTYHDRLKVFLQKHEDERLAKEAKEAERKKIGWTTQSPQSSPQMQREPETEHRRVPKAPEAPAINEKEEKEFGECFHFGD